MGKGSGLIGNFRGKVGNMVGYNLKDSNNKQTQGVRIYQPVVKNPKTYAQSEQRAKLFPINGTYRLLKNIIDRGQESKPYGNKSRLAWLKDAMLQFDGAWIAKGKPFACPARVQITKGSLANPLNWTYDGSDLIIAFPVAPAQAPTTVAALSTALLNGYPQLKSGDQVTLVIIRTKHEQLSPWVISFMLDTDDTTTLAELGLTATTSGIDITITGDSAAATVILSREGSNGEHLRTNSALVINNELIADYFGDENKQLAAESYMASGTTTDWAEEAIQ